MLRRGGGPFDVALDTRGPQAQKVEVCLACNALNRMLELGAARSVAIDV